MEKESRVLDPPPPTNGGVGKCGQNAGGVILRDLQKLARAIKRKRENWSTAVGER